MSDVRYTGPSGDIKPTPGNNQETDAPSFSPALSTYADAAYLKDLLERLLSETFIFNDELERRMVNLALVLTDSPADVRLREAHEKEWPDSLGLAKNIVTYRYYKSLELRDSSAATYIRKRYEEAARDITGDNAIDFIILNNLIRDEALLAQEFVNKNVGLLDDSSERRTVELLQDWAESALQHTQSFQKLFATGEEQRRLPASEVEQIGPEEARNSQALFKVNLNKVNADLTNNIEYLKKSFAAYAPVFYNNFLTPSLNFRKNVTRNVYPVLPGSLGKEVNTAVGAVDNHMASVLADQARRNMIFDEKMTELSTYIGTRDKYRSFILQLAEKGRPIQAGVAGSMTTESDTSEEADYFSERIEDDADTKATFGSPHSYLENLDDPDAHPQYLLKSGGLLEGDLLLGEGVTIDGMSPSTHHHTGQDGTEQIHAGDLLPGSLRTNVIDPSEIPDRPTQLRVINQAIEVVPPGISQLNALISWRGTAEGDLYEIEVAPIAGGGEIKLPDQPVVVPPEPDIIYSAGFLDTPEYNPMFEIESLYGPDQIVGSNFYTPSESISAVAGRLVRKVSDTRFITYFVVYEDSGTGFYLNHIYLDTYDISWTPHEPMGPGDLPYDVAVTRVGTPVEVGWCYDPAIALDMIDSTSGVIAFESASNVGDLSTVIRKINIVGDTITVGAVNTVDTGYQTFGRSVTPFLVYPMTVMPLSSSQVLLSYVEYQTSSGTYRSIIRYFTVSGDTFTETASKSWVVGSPGYSVDSPLIYLTSGHKLSDGSILVSGIDYTIYSTDPDPAFGQSGYFDQLGAEFIAILTVAGSALSLTNLVYPVTPAHTYSGGNSLDPGFLDGRSIPSDQNTTGIGQHPTARRIVNSSRLVPAGTDKFIAVRSFNYTSGSTYYGLEIRPISVSGTTITIGNVKTMPDPSQNYIPSVSVLPASNADGYWIMPSNYAGDYTGYALWVDFDKTANTLSLHEGIGTRQFGKGYGSVLTESDGKLVVAGLGNTSSRVLGNIYDPTIPFYSYVSEDSGTRQNFSVKTGTSVIAWSLGLQRQYAYRTVSIGTDKSVSFGDPVFFPANPTSIDHSWDWGNSIKLSDGKFMSLTEDWSVIGTVVGTSISFGPEQGLPPVTGVDWQGKPVMRRPTLVRVSDTKVACFFATSDDGLTPWYLSVSVGTVDGNNISWAAVQNLFTDVGFESYGSYYDYNPSSYIQPVVNIGNDQFLVLWENQSYSNEHGVITGINQFNVLTFDGTTFTVGNSANLPDITLYLNPWDSDPWTGISLIYDGYSFLSAGDGRAVFVYGFEDPADDYDDHLYARVITVADGNVTVGPDLKLENEITPNLYNPSATVFGSDRWVAIRASAWDGETRYPWVVLLKINDDNTMQPFSFTEYDDVYDNYMGGISASRDNMAFFWTLDWETEFGATDRGLAKVIYLTE